eukprot:CAMPEP_0202101438 /NCGR_PEP_ID=MMETSP0965-20130614/3731_1 /ASSEMBLY_ACC=CAM_ASM_000507 /TAXON_ID=4773 /ORGANISM="Schizochytrium aggregatum, Strain ATCC28209" /LENGTH=407 /DNA_ID=CAMNT_0048670153 /DNA_START=90 /DNA_END=1313 /DNA_ORIENTATION=+
MARRLALAALAAFALAAPRAAAQDFLEGPTMGVTRAMVEGQEVRCLAPVTLNKHIVLLNRCRGDATTLEVEFPGKQTFDAFFVKAFNNNVNVNDTSKDFAVFHVPDLPEPHATVLFISQVPPPNGTLYSFEDTDDGLVFSAVPGAFSRVSQTSVITLNELEGCNRDNMLNSIYLQLRNDQFVGKVFIYNMISEPTCDTTTLSGGNYLVTMQGGTISSIMDLVAQAPTLSPTSAPSDSPTSSPTTPSPTPSPTNLPTSAPSDSPISGSPTFGPSPSPSAAPTDSTRTANPTQNPTAKPSASPSQSPVPPTPLPTSSPTVPSTSKPTLSPVTSSPTPSSSNDDATVAIAGGVVGGVVLLVILGGIFAVKRTKVDTELVTVPDVPVAERISSKPSTPRTPIVPGDDEDEY